MKENMNLSLLQFANIFKTSKKEICICKVDQQLRKHCQRRKKNTEYEGTTFCKFCSSTFTFWPLEKISDSHLPFCLFPALLMLLSNIKPGGQRRFTLWIISSDIMVKGKTSKCSKTSKVQTFLCLEYLLRWHANRLLIISNTKSLATASILCSIYWIFPSHPLLRV